MLYKIRPYVEFYSKKKQPMRHHTEAKPQTWWAGHAFMQLANGAALSSLVVVHILYIFGWLLTGERQLLAM